MEERINMDDLELLTEDGETVVCNGDVMEQSGCGRFPIPRSPLVESFYLDRNGLSNNSCLEIEECGENDSLASSSTSTPPKMDIEFTNITYKINTCKISNCGLNKEPKVLLKGVSGVVKSGELTAIMGPSGAGKSTLMNVLAGYRIRALATGEVKVNGEKRDLDNFRKMSCYIMQDDALLPQLTVMESMMVSANLKIAWKISRKEKKDQVINILDILGLESCRGTKTSQLSGGQRKRLSIALELVYNPPIMFFDEPTSGLDSLSCLQCVKLLKSLALNGKTIVCTIHQPSAKLFEMFDRLYIVAEGNCIYKGPEPGLFPFLEKHGLIIPEHHNPADYIIEVASGIYGDLNGSLAASVRSGLCDQIELKIKSANELMKNADSAKVPTTQSQIQTAALKKLSMHMSKSVESLAGSTYATGFCTQFWVLFVRTFKTILRDTNLTTLRLIAHVCVGLLIGLLYMHIGNEASKTVMNIACLFFCMLFLMFTALMPTVMTFPIEREIMIREHMNYWYSLRAYYFAKTLADTPFQILFPIMYGSIVYFMTEQPPEADRFVLFLLFCMLISLVAQACGLLIGAATSLEASVFLGPITAIPILLFSGFFVTFDSIPVYLQPLSYGSYVRYAFSGTLNSIYGMDRPFLDCANNATKATCQVYKDPKQILRDFKVIDNAIWMDILVMLAFFVAFRGGCYLVLRWKVRANK